MNKFSKFSKEHRIKTGMAFTMTVLIFSILLIAVCVLAILYAFLDSKGLKILSFKLSPVFMFFLMLAPSIVFGTLGTAVFSRIVLNPMLNLARGLDAVANGDFNVRLTTGRYKKFISVADNFNKMAEKLSNVETLRYDFVANFSHEFKTPIVSMRGFAKLLKNANLTPEERTEYIDIIITESNRLARLATNTLLISKLEKQDAVITKTEYRLDEQIRQIILILERRWLAKNINLDISLTEFTINASDDLLYQVWLNLVENAIKFTAENGNILVTLEIKGENAVVTITDDGCGMNEEIQSHVFDKFYQADRSRTTEGNGLGLALVKHIVQLHDGIVSIRSKEGQGTTITVILPKV
jgi:signal transduction histidine kinase